MSKAAYIVLGWNNEDLLKECFDSILAQDYPAKHIIYVDNDSKDNSVAYVREQYPAVEIIETGYNSGFAKGNNIGIEAALKDEEVEYIVLLNTDARLDEKWTSQIAEFAKLKPKGAMFQGTTLDYYDHNIIDSTHIYVSHNGQGTQGNWRYYYKGEWGPKKVFGVNAAACMITRKFIEAQPFDKLFDEALFIYLEDIDLACRATILGWDNYLVPAARAYHMGSVSSGKNPGFSLYMTFRNNGSVLYKNFPLLMLLRMWPKIIKGDIDTIKTLRRTNRKNAVKFVIKGRLAGWLRIPLFIGKRYTMRQNSRIDNKYLWKLMLRGW
jgi:GT2 family glycosyltransferase